MEYDVGNAERGPAPFLKEARWNETDGRGHALSPAIRECGLVRRRKGPHFGPPGLPQRGPVRDLRNIPAGGAGHRGHGDPKRRALYRRGHGHGPGGSPGPGKGPGGAGRLSPSGGLRFGPRPAHYRQPLRQNHLPLCRCGGGGAGGGPLPLWRTRWNPWRGATAPCSWWGTTWNGLSRRAGPS